MNTKMIGVIIVGVIVIGGGAFYGGMKYTTGNAAAVSMSQMRGGQFARNGAGARGSMGMNGNNAFGQILSKDATSITVKLPSGGSRIVFFTPSTTVTKAASSSPADLMVNDTVVVNGTANSDGSLNAQTIQSGFGMFGSRQAQGQ